MNDFPEYGTEDDKNRWAAEEIERWEGARFCPMCGNRMDELHTGHWWCDYCDGNPDIYYGSDDDFDDLEEFEV